MCIDSMAEHIDKVLTVVSSYITRLIGSQFSAPYKNRRDKVISVVNHSVSQTSRENPKRVKRCMTVIL